VVQSGMELTNTFEACDRAAWRDWLAQHHAAEREVWLVFYKKGCGTPSVTYEEAVEEALCFGWIDGLIRNIDDRRHARRFSPRLPGSQWSASNRARVQRLMRAGRMTPAGEALLPADWEAAPEQVERPHPETAALPDFIQAALDAVPALGEKFGALPANLRRAYLNFILDAKREETRQKRLAFVLDHVARGEKIDFMKPLR
jgi:uncharacterized protein YdeI (YjbR/CyaY-like superfamily)